MLENPMPIPGPVLVLVPVPKSRASKLVGTRLKTEISKIINEYYEARP
jgi:hypothetical protein